MVLKQFFALAFIALSMQLSEASAENAWGPECRTLEECLGLIHVSSACKSDDLLCKNNEFSELSQSGLQTEFKKFGKAAIPPLLEILKTGNGLEVERAAEALLSFDDIKPEDYSTIYAAWRRVHRSSIGLLATRYANSKFGKEVTAALRKSPIPESYLANVFSNFREYKGAPSNGITAAITEHVECAFGEGCDSAFAVLQFAWINSNVMEFSQVGQRIAEVLDNPILDRAARIEALNFFRPNEYGRTKEQMGAAAIPIVRKQLNSTMDDVSFEAASILADYGDLNGTEVLLKLAEKQGFEKRIDALKSLTKIGGDLKNSLPRIRKLLFDSDWDVRRHAVILLGTTRSAGVTEDLVKQISSQDWLVTYSALVALRNLPGGSSLVALRNMANTYWHPIVKDAAQNNQSSEPNLSQYPAQEQSAVKLSNSFVASSHFPIDEIQDYEITQWCKSRFQRDGYQFVADFITSPEVRTQSNNASESNSDHFEKMLLKLDVMKGAIKPSLILRYKDWTFVGSPEGVVEKGTTGQLVAEHKGIPSQLLLSQNIAAVFLWSGRPYAVTAGTGPYSKGDGFLVSLIQQLDQTWTTEIVMRLTGAPQYTTVDPNNHSPDAALHLKAFSQVWLAPNQTIGVLGSGGAMLIKPDGTPQWIGCPNPTFP
jgi:HEAT repeats